MLPHVVHVYAWTQSLLYKVMLSVLYSFSGLSRGSLAFEVQIHRALPQRRPFQRGSLRALRKECAGPERRTGKAEAEAGGL